MDAEKYDRENPEVWDAFKRCAFQMVQSGRRYYSARTILHHLRWESDVRGNGDFKVCNDISAYYSRKFIRIYPQYEGFFSMKKSQFDVEEVESQSSFF